MDSLWDLKDMLCEQIEDIVKKGDISPTELDHVYKVVDVIKDIVTIDAMEHPEAYSFDMNPYNEKMSYRSSYRDGRRGRDGDSDGRYSERYGMSRHTEKEMLTQEIANLQRRVDQMK